MDDSDAFRELVYDRIADVLLVLSAVSTGNYDMKLASDLPEDDPIGALYNGINDTISSLAEFRTRSEAYQRELEEKLAMIDRQQTAIRELSTPVIELWQGVLCLPIVGIMDSTRSAEMQDALLRAVAEKKARCTIIDITGIEVMDTGTADHFVRMAKAVRLLGAKCFLTGISPGIAQTIVHMGIDLGGVVTFRSLRDALKSYVREATKSPTKGKAPPTPGIAPRTIPDDEGRLR